MSESPKDKHFVIKKIKKVKHGSHHGGAWKLAYADFVTAMMAFFLLLWLLSLLNKYELSGVGEYFKKPLKDVFNKSEHIQPQRSKHLIGTVEKSGDKKLGDKNAINQDKKISKDTQTTKLQENNQGNKQEKSQENKQEVQGKIANLNEMLAIKKEIDKNINTNPSLKDFKHQLDVKITKQGLRITLKDLDHNPMFPTGDSEFVEKANKVFPLISREIAKYNNRIVVIGHTDSDQYQDKINYTNWELSADRANATRRALVKSGTPSSQFLRIDGMADVDPLNKLDPHNGINRRIEIVVLTKKAAQEAIEE